VTAALAGTNFTHHAAGFVENMLCVAYEQYVIDDEINGAVMRLVRGIQVSDDTLSVDLIDEVCRHEGHYLVTDQSVALMRTEFYYPHTADRLSRLDWETGGALDMRERARQRARAILATHRPPCLDPAVDAAVRARFEILLQE
jgi:trimethylamine--corrinoid protein Co-methyltransferase